MVARHGFGKDTDMTNTFAGLAAAAMLSITIASPAAAAPFTLVIFESTGDVEKRTDTGETGTVYWESYAAFADEAAKAGVLRGGSALHAAQEVYAVAGKDGVVTETAAFDVDAPLRLSGYFQIDVADAASAIAWAAKIPGAKTGRIEIRAGYPAPGMK